MNAAYAIHTVSLNKLPPAAPALYWGGGRWGGLKNANEYKTIGSALRTIRRMVEAGLWAPRVCPSDRCAERCKVTPE